MRVGGVQGVRNVFSYDFGCKKKAVSDIPASRLTLIDFEVNTGKPA